VLLPLRVRLEHLSWNNSGGSATAGIGANTLTEILVILIGCLNINPF
jgi:hypothetical protein